MNHRITLSCTAMTVLCLTAADAAAQNLSSMPPVSSIRTYDPWAASFYYGNLANNTLAEYAAIAGGEAPTTLDIEFNNTTVTVNLPTGRHAADFILAECTANSVDLVVATTDSTQTGPGTLLIYIDVANDTTLDHTVSVPGPGTTTFADVELETVRAITGALERVLLGAPTYSPPGMPEAGLLLSVDVSTGVPVINFGYQGGYAGARFGDAIAARDAEPGVISQILACESGYSLLQGNQGRAYGFHATSGTPLFLVDGPAGGSIGTEATYHDGYWLISNADADDIGQNQVNNGVQGHLDSNLNGFFGFGGPGERLGVFLAPAGPGAMFAASDRAVKRFLLGSAMATHIGIPDDPLARTSGPLIVQDVPNFDDPLVTHQTSVTSGQTTTYRSTVFATHARLIADLLRLSTSQPDVINISVDDPPMAGGFVAYAAAFGAQLGEIQVPGIDGFLVLTPPIFPLGISFLDPTGFGFYTFPWPGHPSLPGFLLTFSAVAFPASSSPLPPGFENHVTVEFFQ